LTSALYQYRWLLLELVSRDLVLRYRGSILGFLWTLLNPLLFLTVYTLVFSVYLRVPIPHYPVFLIAGLVPWTWFAGAVTMGATSIVDGRMFVGKAVFTPVVLVLVPPLSHFINFALSLPILAAICMFYGAPLGLPILALPVLVVIQIIFTTGVLLAISTLNVFFRDMQNLVQIFVMIALYLSPIFYPLTSVPETFRPFVLLNPMVPVVLGYQNIFYYGKWPNWIELSLALVVALAVYAFGVWIFERYKDSLGEYL
jgi:ABC-type polysaccharide/polyol phosphate export permease